MPRLNDRRPLSKEERERLQLIAKDISVQIQPYIGMVAETFGRFKKINLGPILAMQENMRKLAKSFAIPIGLIETFKEIGESQKRMVLMLSSVASSSLAVQLPDIVYSPPTKPETYYPPTYEVFEEVEEIKGRAFGVNVTIEGRFIYKNRMLRSISTNSKHGKFFKMLLTNEDNYVTDQEVKENIGVADDDKGIGYIRKDLAKYLRKDGIQVELYRQRGEGYKLMAVKRLLN